MHTLRYLILVAGSIFLFGLTACGNPANSNAATDTIAPDGPTGLTALAEFGRLSLIWTDPVDDDLTRIAISRTPGTGTTYEVLAGVQGFVATELTAGTEYTFTLRAYDASGNASIAQSVTGTAPPAIVRSITASNGSADDEFGVAVAIDGDYAIIASEDFPSNNRDGIVYLFERDANGDWTERTFFDRTGTGHGFGHAVDISGSTAVGSADDNSLAGQYVLVIERDSGGTWSERATLTPSDLTSTHSFGASVSLSGDYVVAGAPRASEYTGSVYVFERNAGNWPATETAKLVASDARGGDQFGASVAISGTTAAVGAPYREAAGGLQPGAVYVFERDGSGAWHETATLTTSEPVTDLELGRVIAINGDTIAANAPNYSEVASSAGAVFVFERDLSGSWNETQRIEPSDIATNDRFGASIDISDDVMIIGSESGDTDTVSDAGTVYVYRRNASGKWIQISRLIAPSPTTGADFGGAVAISGSRVFVGADRSSPGSLNEAGEGYVFE